MKELTKTSGADKERGVVQKEIDSLASSTSTLESTSIPLARKEIEVLKREIERQDQNFNLLSRKIGLSKTGSVRVTDMIEANKNTLLSQQTELVVIKKAVNELQKDERELILEEKRDEESLNRIYELLRVSIKFMRMKFRPLMPPCMIVSSRVPMILPAWHQRKQQSQKSKEEGNRLLESAVTKAEQITEQRRSECENAREGHNAESKSLIRLRGELSAAKKELLTFLSQVKSINGDISRADDLVFKEHVSQHNVNSEKQHIETDIAAFHDKISRLSLTSNANGCVIQLGQEIDDADEQKEVLRRNYRNIMNKKDIASALLVANEFEHRKVARTIESMTGEIRGTMNRFHQLEEALETTKATTNKLLDEKERRQALIESQGKQNEILVALENDLENQLFKNSVLSVEIGRPMNLHRWRFLQDKAPEKFSMLESIHNHQRQAIDLSQRIANQTCTLERSKVSRSKLRQIASCHQSVDYMRSHLSSLKSEFNALHAEMKVLEKQLQERIDQAADLNSDIVMLEKKSMNLKANYLVSVVSGR